MAERLNLENRIMRGRVRLLIGSAFFGTLLTRMKMIEVPAGVMPCDTMATDGKSLFWFRGYLEKLPDLQLQGLFAHEVMHVALGHHLRRGSRDPKQWNIACDGAIDFMLKEAGFDVPDSFAEIAEYAWMQGRSAEEIYALLPTKPSPPPQKDANGKAGPPRPGTPGGEPRAGGIMDSKAASSPAAAAQAEQEMRILVHQAAMAQKAQKKGSVPGWLKTFIDDLMAPKVRWQDHLRVFIAQHIPAGQTWAKVNRRFAHTGLYLPGQLKEGIGEGAIYFDTSGSTMGDWPQFLSECNSILEDCKPERVHVLQCDAKMQDIATYERGETINNDVTGGGGSNFCPAFAAVEEARLPLKWAIVLSDMHIDFPKHKPSYPVLMFTTTDTMGPSWATTIRMH